MRTRYHWISVSVTPFCMFQIAFSLPHAFLPFHLICMWHYHHSTQVLYKIGQKSVTDYYCFRLWWFRKWRVWTADVVGMCLVMSRVHEVRTLSVPCATLGPAFHLPSGSHLHLTWNVDNDSQPPSPCAAVQMWFTWSIIWLHRKLFSNIKKNTRKMCLFFFHCHSFISFICLYNV